MMVVNGNEWTIDPTENVFSVHHLREEEAASCPRSRVILNVKGFFRKGMPPAFVLEQDGFLRVDHDGAVKVHSFWRVKKREEDRSRKRTEEDELRRSERRWR